MEKWIEICKGLIPIGQYTVEMENGEGNGLVIKLENKNNLVVIDFGAISAVRMLDEGIILQGLFDDSELKKYKVNGFANTIYKIENGDFGNSIKKMSGDMYDALKLGHYLVITLNYVIEIISSWEPEIDIS